VKKILPVLVFALTATAFTTSAQNSCPTIINSTFKVTDDAVVPCMKTVSFDFINPSSGNKRINVTVNVANIDVLNICYDASGQNGVQRTITTPAFTACNLAAIKVLVTPYTGSSCGSAACAPTIISIGGALLPVIFSSFTVSRMTNNVQLKWSTGTEINNKGFIIERNSNGSWEQVGYVASTALNGNSSSRIDYQYTDASFAKGMTQYRIKQVDIDNSFKYSEVRAIRGLEQDAKTVVFPNPSNDGKTTVVFADASRRDIAVTDMAGRTITQYRSYTANSLQLSNLLPGMYSLRTTNLESGEISTEKIIVAMH
jgi:hypothetical protein